jgi:hypothetical protein
MGVGEMQDYRGDDRAKYRFEFGEWVGRCVFSVLLVVPKVLSASTLQVQYQKPMIVSSVAALVNP